MSKSYLATILLDLLILYMYSAYPCNYSIFYRFHDSRFFYFWLWCAKIYAGSLSVDNCTLLVFRNPKAQIGLPSEWSLREGFVFTAFTENQTNTSHLQQAPFSLVNSRINKSGNPTGRDSVLQSL